MAGPINQPDPGETPIVEPTADEIERWAALERERREAWLRGPTEEQKAAWAAREHERRRSGQRSQLHIPAPSADTLRTAQYALREAQLAAEGAMSLAVNVSVRELFDLLVRAGREWEDEYTSRPVRRRRVALDVVASDIEVSTEPPASKAAASSEGVAQG